MLAKRGLDRVFRLNRTLGAALDRGLVDRRDTRSPEFSIFDGGDFGHEVNGSLAWLLCSKRRFPSWESTKDLNPRTSKPATGGGQSCGYDLVCFPSCKSARSWASDQQTGHSVLCRTLGACPFQDRPAGSSPAKTPGKVVKRGGQGSSGGRAKRPKTQHDAYDDLDDIEDFDIIKKEEDDEDKKVIFVDEA
ncbi:tRNA selenocysteine-associated protein 1 [Apiospora hydei]|uniref:tRNA selenocysteine-associated protein 1 n=1 Tax=Apiospora hydei TaxID=1337664 RepID=A0ABR1VH72_9PEZI